MTTQSTERASTDRGLPKAPTGIQGLDELTRGGLPRGRPTLVCGSAGCGKTVLGIEFLVRGATQFNEPGVLMAFEETAEELTQNVRSLGFDLDELVMYILKSRGMAHSNQLREFLLTDHGIELEDVYLGPEGVLTGSSRLAQEAKEKAATTARGEEIEAKRRELERARQASEAQIAAIRLEFQAKEDELRRAIAEEEAREQGLVQARVEMSHSRKADR